jgi:hypothetical protein
MLIAKSGSRTGVSGACHELPGCGALGRSPGEAGTPQIMKVDLGTSQVLTGCPSGGVEGMTAQPPALRPGQQRSGSPWAYEGPQVPLEARQHVGRDADHRWSYSDEYGEIEMIVHVRRLVDPALKASS